MRKTLALVGFPTPIAEYIEEKLRMSGYLIVNRYEHLSNEMKEEIQIFYEKNLLQFKQNQNNLNCYMIGSRKDAFLGSISLGLDRYIEMPFELDELIQKIS